MKRLLVMLILPFICIVGCGTNAPTAKPTKLVAEKHNHEEVGPSGGSLVSWGDEEYHAELVVEAERGAVTVNVLDGNIKKLVPIDSKTITLTLQATPPVVMTLTPKPNEGDPVGLSSRFVATSESLKAPKSWKGSLSGTVQGKNYTGDFEQKPAGKK